ncbi:MAG: hypothetical protein ABSB35_25125 [Bryobacteraceae bacterium]
MTEMNFANYVIGHDRAATVAAYERFARGEYDRCDCSGCRNFAARRNNVFPEAALSLFSDLGIDPEYEGEVFHYGRDPNTRMYEYGGWYYFVGTVLQDGDIQKLGDFSFHFGTTFPKPPPPLEGQTILKVNFIIRLPWVIEEPEPDPPISGVVSE